ncbi:MAG: LysM peptidoglycan-binding domain-containing protein [Chloroflexota bacterium]
MSNIQRRIPLIGIGLLTTVLFFGITALILWSQRRPLNADPGAVTAETTPIVVGNPADSAGEYQTIGVIIEEENILLSRKVNEQMVIYVEPEPTLIPTVTPTPQQVAEVPDETNADAQENPPQQITPTRPVIDPANEQEAVTVPDNIQTPVATQVPVQPAISNSSGMYSTLNHLVVSGDNMFRLACTYDSSIPMLAREFSREDLIPGETIVITQPNPNYCGSNAQYEYAIKEADTVFKLSTATGVAAETIRSLNQLSANYNITAGEVLCFPQPVPQGC